jgi:uncharacterized membrane protein YhaH (DUF805 family)
MMDYQNLLLNAQGRINRQTYWIGVAIIFVAALVLYLLALATGGTLRTILFVIIYLAFLYPSICLAIKRFHDRDKSGWWVFIALVPLIGGIWYFIEVGCLPGTVGPNQFGPDSRTA